MDRKKVRVTVMSISNVEVSPENVTIVIKKNKFTISNTRLDFLLEA